MKRAVLLSISLCFVACTKAPAKTREEAIAYLETKPGWLPSIDRCPAASMPEQLVLSDFVEGLCTKDQLGDCLKKCEDGDARACFAAATELRIEGKPDPITEALFQRACELGDAGGCTNRTSGRMLVNQGVIDDCTIKSFRRSCNVDDAWACAFLAGVLTAGGDKEEIARASEKACKLAPDKPPCEAVKQLKEAAATLPQTKPIEAPLQTP